MGFVLESLMEIVWYFIGFIKKVNIIKIWIFLGYDFVKLKYLFRVFNRFFKLNFVIKSIDFKI